MAGIGGWAGARRGDDSLRLARLLGGEPLRAWSDADAALAWAPRQVAGATLATNTTTGLAVGADLVVAFDGVLAERAAFRTLAERRGEPVDDTTSDADLIALAWRALGAAALDRLEGTFALAVWSRATRELVLARDRVGGRALSWTVLSDGVALFASRASAVAATVGAPRDELRVYDLLVQGHVSPPHTLFRGVRGVEPGHVVRVDARGVARSTRYFAPSFIPRTGAREELTTRLDAVVRGYLDSAKLEGRAPAVLLDGTAGGAAIASIAGAQVPTVSVHVAGEADPGAEQARALRTDHAVIAVSPERVSIADAVRDHGGPFATPWPLIARALRESGRGLVLAGLGAESLAGAPPRLSAEARGGDLAPWAGRTLRRGAELIADVTLAPLRPWLESVAAIAGASETPFGRRLLHAEGVFPPDLLGAIARPAVRPALFDVTRWSDRVVDEATTTSPIGRALARRVRGRLAEELIPGLDGPLAAAGIELRLPFLDRRAVELASGLDARDRPHALAALVPAGVPRELDDDATIGRWMSGGLEPRWRDAVFGDGSPVMTLLDPARVRPLLLADTAWNPGRWRQALALWSLGAWMADASPAR